MKVKAFEKHATNVIIEPEPEIPAQRMTRTKTKAKISVLEEQQQQQQPQHSRIARLVSTPSSNYVTPSSMSKRGAQNSESKLAHLQRSNSQKTLLRDNSTEDMKRNQTPAAVAEEKKRKREEKQKLAQQQREAKEKERIEAAERLAHEREEKHKRIMQEKEEKLKEELIRKKLLKEKKAKENESKKQLEEIERNIRLAEQRREEIRRLENQKRFEMQIAEAARREKEAKVKAQQHKVTLQQSVLHKNSELKKKMMTKNHDFEALESGDSTDEEGKHSKKKPPSPNWSIPSVRYKMIMLQSTIDTKIIDNFFSVQPMSPDLRDIFPTIEAKYLKRNSSAIWNTPPRYSQMPKY